MWVSDPDTYMVRIWFAFQNREWQGAAVGYLGTRYPKVGPQPPPNPFADQLPAEQPSEVERMTKSPPSNPVRWRGLPSPHQATLWGRAIDQVAAEQPCEAERTTKSLPSNSVRRKGRSSTSDPRQHDKTHHHQTTSGPRVWHTEGRQGIHVNMTVRQHVRSLACLICLVGPVNPSHGGPQHWSLYGNPRIVKDKAIYHTGCMPTHAWGWCSVRDERWSCIATTIASDLL
jgi:hypothetical protein